MMSCPFGKKDFAKNKGTPQASPEFIVKKRYLFT
jgi:hypothetical protein